MIKFEHVHLGYGATNIIYRADYVVEGKPCRAYYQHWTARDQEYLRNDYRWPAIIVDLRTNEIVDQKGDVFQLVVNHFAELAKKQQETK